MARPVSTIKDIEDKEKAADRKREKSGSLLHLASVLGMKKTLAEQALESINANQSKFATQLSYEDLKSFSKQVNQLKKDYKKTGISGGISPRAIINRSRRIDIERCQAQITSAVPIRHDKNGVVTFRTNASSKSDDTYHIVTVQFLNFQAALNAGRNSDSLANSVSRGAIKFDCDCGRHRFWYRYIATVGGFAYGKPETGFPKIRNPELTGLACKHVLRVMLILEKSPAFTAYMKKYIEKYRKDGNSRINTFSKKQAEKLEEAIKAESWQVKKIRQSKTGTEKVDIKSAFNTHSPKSIKGKAVTPKELAKQKKEESSLSEIERSLNILKKNMLLGKISPDVVKKLMIENGLSLKE